MRKRVADSVPLARPDITDAEINAVIGVLRSGVLSLGEQSGQFEQLLVSLTGRQFAVACSSGTAALHLAVRALGIGESDEVITSPFSFVASANCILYERAIPRFVDIEEETLGLDPDLVDEVASRRTRAILPVDVFGNPCRLPELETIARDRGWVVIEDACEALGSRLNGRPLGAFGDVSAFAFYPNKQITTGEGGVVLVDDPDVASAMRSMRNQGRDEDGTWLRHIRLGYNYRMDEMSAALGVVQLQRLEELRTARSRVLRAYVDRLSRFDWVQLPTAAPGADVDWFVFVVRLEKGVGRDALIPALAERGIPARPYFSPLHLQPFYRTLLGHRPGDFPVTERVAASTLALPYGSHLTIEQIDRVVEALADSVARQAGGARSK